MSKFRVPRSTYLAVIRAKQSVAQEAPIEASEARKLLEAIDIFVGLVRERCAHIGLVNEAIEKMIEDGAIDNLPAAVQDRLTSLLSDGIAYAVENSGFGGGHW